MPRIPPCRPEDLSPEMAEIYHSSPAGKLNIFRLHCHAPTCFPATCANWPRRSFATLDVPPLERELVVLVVAVLQDCEYEWAQHAQIAAAMGIPQEQIDAVRASDWNNAVFNDREKACSNSPANCQQRAGR
jgi:AhpD family alkylhydroperoxidase